MNASRLFRLWWPSGHISNSPHHTSTHTLGFIMAQKQIELQDLDLQQLVEVKKQLEDVRSHPVASVQDWETWKHT